MIRYYQSMKCQYSAHEDRLYLRRFTLLAFLREACCDEAQGYWLARLLEGDVFTGAYVDRLIEQPQQLSRHLLVEQHGAQAVVV